MLRQIILDTETTGLSPEAGHRVIEIGCVELLDRKLTGRNLHLYLNPEREVDEEARAVHGLSNDFLSDKPKFAEVADELTAYLQGAELIIHNAPFDMGFLNMEMQRLGRPALSSLVAGVIDTLAMAKQAYPGKRNSLDALCSRLEVDNSGRTFHGALLDAELLAEVYIRLTRGQETLLIEEEEPAAALDEPTEGPSLDLSRFELPVLYANAQEIEAHDEVLRQIDKSSQGKTIWTRANAEN